MNHVTRTHTHARTLHISLCSFCRQFAVTAVREIRCPILRLRKGYAVHTLMKQSSGSLPKVCRFRTLASLQYRSACVAKIFYRPNFASFTSTQTTSADSATSGSESAQCLTLLPIMERTSSSGDVGVPEMSGLLLLRLRERLRLRLAGRTAERAMVA